MANKKPRRTPPEAYHAVPGQDISTFVHEFFKHHIAIAENADEDFKNLTLPLARIKKVIKSDPDVKMVASEVPVLFSKACEMFIAELTARAWMIADQQKHRTLTKADIAAAVERGDMFDFLIDIVPRTQEISKSRQKDDREPGQPSDFAHRSSVYPPIPDPSMPDASVSSSSFESPALPWQQAFDLPPGHSTYLGDLPADVPFHLSPQRQPTDHTNDDHVQHLENPR